MKVNPNMFMLIQATKISCSPSSNFDLLNHKRTPLFVAFVQMFMEYAIFLRPGVLPRAIVQHGFGFPAVCFFAHQGDVYL